MTALRRIAITGPESTGKSWLASGLAAHYQTVFVPEFARGYIEQLGRPYEYDDLLQIAKGQLSAEAEKEKVANGLLFCDTELIVIKIWSLHKYGKCHPFIIEQIKNHCYDFFLLCNVDLPWQYDEQREHPHLREYFFNWYCKELEDYGFNYSVVSGLGKDRLGSAVEAVEKMGKWENGKMRR